jgi:DNA polymerase III delta prime subunit
MVEVNDREFLWVEKYRPQSIEECILPESLKNTFKEFIKSGQVPNFLFSGSAGVGKTTIAKALCNEIGAEFLMINGSDEGRSIDTLRTTIRSFASTVSLTDARKVVIIDEADYTNAQSVQPALRNFMEEFSANCRFILTCNFKNRIIEPLHSRCTCVEFKIDAKDKQQIAASFFKRATSILKIENVEFEPKVVAELVTKHFPDYRRILNELQRYSVSGKIDSGILVNASDETFTPLLLMLKEKNFTEVRKWVGINSDIESSELFRKIYDKSVEHIEMTSIPQLVLILADYGYKNAFVTDREINTMACLTEVMSSCTFK